jgi:predicted transcriptional regulator
MNKIDIHNYEAYLLDFSEGNLSDEYQMELELFLIQHPELNCDLSELSLVALENESVSFSDKNSLKKSITDLVSETQFIGYIENQLSIDEKLNIEKSCAANPSLAKELKLYNSTIVKAESLIVYENKESLKRKSRIIWFNFSATKFAAAASVLFLIGLFIFWTKTETTISNLPLADKTNKQISTTKNFIDNNSINHKNTTTKTSNAKNKNLLVAYKPVISNSQPALEKLTVTSQNKNIASIFKDSIDILVKNNSVIENTKEEILIAQNAAIVLNENKQSVVEVITENDDETIVLNMEKKKRGVWETVSRTLKNLNHIGIKSVNGDEENNKENTFYALTLGDVSIKHKAGNL